MRTTREILEAPGGRAGEERPRECGGVSLLEPSGAGCVTLLRAAGNGEDSKTEEPVSSDGGASLEVRAPANAEEKSQELDESLADSHSSEGNLNWKRALDLVCIFLFFPFWLPLMLAMALWIKFASPGPVIYKQQRIGYRGRKFMILKFRSMKLNVDTGSHERHLATLMQKNCPMTKLDSAGDSRLIPGGRLLRATGLDELPQIFNVLRGQMSLVGPRPCTPFEFSHYTARQTKRVNAPPGLTGYWQVNGKNKTTFSRMIALDLLYAKRMSLRLDLAIMAKTIPALVIQVLETRRAKAEASSEKNLQVLSSQPAQNI